MLKIECLGRVVKDPYTNDPAVSGKKRYTAITLVSSRYAGTNPDNSPRYDSIFMNCVAFDRAAESLARVTKGDYLWVSGEPSIDTYEKDGKTNTNLKCVIREWDRVTPSTKSESSKADDTEVDSTTTDDSEDLFG